LIRASLDTKGILEDLDAQPTRQVLALKYSCQSCRSEDVVFLVRRERSKLTLTGRTPIEHVDIPKSLPNEVERFYAGAVVAHQSGQTLAGNFLLRTLIEQWVRTFPAANLMRAEDALDWYYDHLPIEFREKFPSLRELYAELSADIHAAAGAAELFESASSRIIRHFEAFRLFELDRATLKSEARPENPLL
jgi:hypothetical protein